MEYERENLTPERMREATKKSISSGSQQDADQRNRELFGYCIACHYERSFSLQAFTRQPCSGCGEVQVYPNSRTDVLCRFCSDLHSLCKHCGADKDLNPDREFPVIGNLS